ncbi:hypothetical protein EK0264_03595 [Epidermidibacterium keratini]|uniref:Uncharacterized protein n=1 Tax=Epidermidibacterium keratini TaxID=1891644 RepID=A0A7L4YKS6_9ACTN|nr:hypothetical protein [Epidermidibacterium keratini]QHB99453.1 hypothetical protein EK0264_03595 [Epidermidibacterium keratini]
MTELDTFTPGEAYQAESTSALVEWANGARAANGIAQSLAQTPFVPQSMQGKPALVTAAILAGFELGLQPISALRSIDVIQGTPAMRAHAIRGLVQSRGHEVWVEEATTTRAKVSGRRKGSDRVQTSTWTLDRAKGLNLTGKDNWRKQPQAMLVARATSELCRMIASDVLLGLPYSAEEIQDGADDESVAEKPKRTIKRKPAERPEPVEPELDEPPLPEPEDPPAVENDAG